MCRETHARVLKEILYKDLEDPESHTPNDTWFNTQGEVQYIT